MTKEQDWLDSMKAGEQGFAEGRFTDAIKAFESATKILPGRVEGWINLGSALLEAGRVETAATALKNAISIKPELALPHMLLGDALRQLGLSAQALASYQRAVSLQRSPMGLNKLACALRIARDMEQAEKLYQEAVRLEPGFTLAQVNLATLNIEMERFEEAAAQLSALAKLPLPPAERREVKQSMLALDAYFRLQEPIASLARDNNPAPLETALADTSHGDGKVDEDALEGIRPYFQYAHERADFPSILATRLPDDWPLIESLFMRGIVNSVDDYLEVSFEEVFRGEATGELRESLNMEAVIQAARMARGDLLDPLKAELHLRQWHALACRGLAGFLPGHFKYTQNWVAANPTSKRVEPALASSTLRHLISDMYRHLEPGLARAAFAWIALGDLHPFSDGNGRVARSWLNRELEWAGLMPALFGHEQGLKQALADAIPEVHAGAGDLSPVLDVIVKAQEFAADFCDQLAKSQRAVIKN
ncbi:MAG: tetratricopeptide repeat protein [Xanthomonadales bacterium]|nr:tetratricopeptide repeat protein [Xanthomonadales bacterium]